MTETYFVTGSTGYLGHEVVRVLNERGIPWIPIGRAEGFDLADGFGLEGKLESAVRAHDGPVTLIHMAAESRWLGCEAAPDLAFKINGEATAILAAVLRRLDARMVYISTDLVFAGDAAPYAEQDEARPSSIYGKSKKFGETSTLAAIRNLVIRLPLLYGPSFDGKRGATDMVTNALGQGQTLDLFDDEWRTPLDVKEAATQVVDLALDSSRHGIAHLPGPERLSRLELGLQIAREHGLDESLIHSASRLDMPGPPRPMDCSLISSTAPVVAS